MKTIHSQALLASNKRFSKSAFAADLTEHLDKFNLRLQGETTLVRSKIISLKAPSL